MNLVTDPRFNMWEKRVHPMGVPAMSESAHHGLGRSLSSPSRIESPGFVGDLGEALKGQRLLFRGGDALQFLENTPILLEMESELQAIRQALFPADGRLPSVEGVLWTLKGESSESFKWMTPGESLPTFLTHRKGYDKKKGETPYTWLKIRVKAPEGEEFVLTVRPPSPYASRNFLFRSQNLYLSRVHPNDTAKAASPKSRSWNPFAFSRESSRTFELNQNIWLVDRNDSKTPVSAKDYETFHYLALREAPESGEPKRELEAQSLFRLLLSGDLESRAFGSESQEGKPLQNTQRYQKVLNETRQLMDDLFTRLNLVSPVYWDHYQTSGA